MLSRSREDSRDAVGFTRLEKKCPMVTEEIHFEIKCLLNADRALAGINPVIDGLSHMAVPLNATGSN